MTHTLALDTLQYSKRLQKAGFTEVQAEAQVEIIKEQVDAISSFIDDSLATKQDIAELKRDIKEIDLKIEILKNELTASMAKMGYGILISLGAMITVAASILGFLIKMH
jgi:hypothetical protein